MPTGKGGKGPTPHTSFRLSTLARAMLRKLSLYYGVSQRSVLEELIRETYRKEEKRGA